MAPAFHVRPGSAFQPSRRSRRTPTLSSTARDEQVASNVVDTAYDEAGVRLATAQEDGSISLWRTTGKNEWAVEAHFNTRHPPGTLRVIRFAPARLSPAIVVTAGSDGIAVVYKVFEQAVGDDEGEVTAREVVLRDATKGLTAIAFADDGKLATVGEERVLRVYESPDNGERWGLMAAVDVGQGVKDAGGVSFAPGGKFCVACGDIVARGATDWEWEVYARIADGDPEGEESGSKDAVVCADWASSGYIGVGRQSGAVEVWQMKHGQLSRVAHMAEPEDTGVSNVVKIEWDRAGGVLATAHEDKVVRTWARMPGEELGSWLWRLRDKIDLVPASGLQ